MNDIAFRRFRRIRNRPALRDMIRETVLSMNDFIYPMFIAERPADAGPVTSMPGVARLRLDELEREIEQVAARRIRSVLLFGIPAAKDERGSAAYDADGVICRAIRKIKSAREDLAVVADVCLCEYTDHGHCGVLQSRDRKGAGFSDLREYPLADARGSEEQSRDRKGAGSVACIDNDRTLELLAKAAVAYADAGADVVAPSAMMDGQVAAIRVALDGHGRVDTAILSYAVKYASALYGPFRDAAACAPRFGDRRGHQMDPANVREALAEARADVTEGADMLMVKPAGAYLDVIAAVRREFPNIPIAAYQVSGEYSMIKAAAANGWLDERRVVMESLTAIKRAGADVIISYFAKDAADYLATS